MKKINNALRSFFGDARYLALWVVIALIIPNVVLDITESWGVAWKVANVLLPAGFYVLWMCCARRAGVMTLLALPFMILGAFQLVLSYLYGESIIAVDMFLNVVTTNVDEVSELLGNLLIAIFTVVVLYLPPLVWGGVAICKKMQLPGSFMKSGRIAGGIALIAGVAFALFAPATPTQRFYRCIFPVNVCFNLAEAVNRTKITSRYPETSAHFTYNATSVRDSSEREIYIFVIGETARAINWQLGGYERATNPRLAQKSNLRFMSKALSESNTTHKSVPMLMSVATAESFDSINHIKSIITAMKEAGFYTRFFSNQSPNRSFTQYFGDEADDVRYCDFTATNHPYDAEVLPWVSEAVADTCHTKQFIVIHTYGSHFLYRDRYPREFACFLPDDGLDANVTHRSDLINAYDNTILYTDHLLSELIATLEGTGVKAGLLYSSDHGEDIFDDERERFLHASPNPTYFQLHVAMLAWLSDSIGCAYPQFVSNLNKNALKGVSPQKSMFHTAMEMAGVDSPLFNANLSLINEGYEYQAPVYLTDLNVAVPLENSGLKKQDVEQIRKVLGVRR